MEKQYVMRDIADEKTYRIVTKDGVYRMLKDFQYDYMVGLVEDLYHACKGTSAPAYGIDFVNRIYSLMEECDRYKNIEKNSFSDACQKLENEYDIVIRELGAPVHAKDIEKDFVNLSKAKEDGVVTDSKGDKYYALDDSDEIMDLVHQMLYGE